MNYFTSKVRPSHEGDNAGPGMMTKVSGFFTSAVVGVFQSCEAIVLGSWDLASQVISSTVVKSISNVAAMVTFELFVYAILAVSCILIAFVLNFDQMFKKSKDKGKTEPPPQAAETENTEVPPSELPPPNPANAADPAVQPPADPVFQFNPTGL